MIFALPARNRALPGIRGHLPPDHAHRRASDRNRGAAPALDILQKVKRRGEHVFPSSVGDKPLVGVNRAWEKVRTLAGISDVPLHDLRPSFATFAVENGASLFQVGRALGHAKSVSTERYAHPTDAGARAIARRGGAVRAAQRAPVAHCPRLNGAAGSAGSANWINIRRLNRPQTKAAPARRPAYVHDLNRYFVNRTLYRTSNPTFSVTFLCVQKQKCRKNKRFLLY